MIFDSILTLLKPFINISTLQLPTTKNGKWFRLADRSVALLRCDPGNLLTSPKYVSCFVEIKITR